MRGLHEIKRQLKYSAIRMGLEAISLLRLNKLLPFAAKNGLIFTLHHVRPDAGLHRFSPNAILSVTPEFLEEVVQQVLSAGMIPVHVHELPHLLQHNPQNKRYVCFTLDDGYCNNAQYAAPVFRRYNIPYTIYITSGFAERSHILWWEVIEHLLRRTDKLVFDFGCGQEALHIASTAGKMSAFMRFARFVDSLNEDEAVRKITCLAKEHGIDPLQMTQSLTMDAAQLRQLKEQDGDLVHFGAHSVSHINLAHADEQRINDEIITSANWLKEKLDQVPLSFAYPYGWKTAVNEKCWHAARKAGFEIAVTTQASMTEPANLNHPQAFPRVSLNGYFQKSRYVRALISGIPFINIK